MASTPDLIPSAEAAALLGLSVSQLNRLAASGKLEAVRIGARGPRVFDRQAVAAFAAGRETR